MRHRNRARLEQDRGTPGVGGKRRGRRGGGQAEVSSSQPHGAIASEIDSGACEIDSGAPTLFID
jgi:hypothetical protein